LAKRTLNDRIIKALKPAKPGQRREIWDALVPGLGIRVTDTSAKSFVLVARYPGSANPARRAIGAVGAISLTEARARAKEWLALIQRGLDPAIEVERQRLVEQRKRADTFAAVAEDFIREKLPAERKGAEVARDLRRVFIPALGKRPIAEITARDIVEIIKPIAARAPYQAHNLLGHIKRMFSWAIDQAAYGIETSPVDRLKPRSIIGERKPRSRILCDDELRALWRATGEMGYPFGNILRMLLLTGQRHHEVSEAPWSELDLAKAIWTISQERFKSELPHIVPLTKPVIELLTSVPRFKSGDHVFTTSFGKLPTCISNKIKTALDGRMAEIAGRKLEAWKVHDLRRTMRSHLSALKIPDHIAEMVIGHGRQGLQRVYDQHRYEDELREALDLWAARLRSIIEPPPANVVALRAKV
jgi:integrase